MRIAQVAPLYESVPPKKYGGTERVVSYLTEELMRQGHDVTLFASGDSVTSARLIAPCPRALRLEGKCRDPLVHHVLLLETLLKHAETFDIVHFHCDFLHFPISRRWVTPHVTTLHGRLDIPELRALYREFREVPLISISNAQRKPLPWVNWLGTAYHGLPPEQYGYRDGRGGYLAFVGRISREKGVDKAVEIAERVGMPLRIAAKVDESDRSYFREVEHLFDRPLVEFVGEIGEAEKGIFLGDAHALLFPIDWPEPFGLVMVEAMASGTPIIATPRGSVPEVIDDGVTGFVVDGVEDAVNAVRRVPALDRRRCRRVFEERFSVGRMARDYLTLYERLLEGEREAAVGG